MNQDRKSRGSSRSRSRDDKKEWTQQRYDKFLLNSKKGTFKRLDPFTTLSAGCRHQCNNCHRIWKPSPKKCLADDYYCPSCALHHRNNILRFQQQKFSWTASIPNTFYLYKIVDEKTKVQFYKYGRTQNQKPDDRYSSTQRNLYKMSLQYSLRGSLKNMTAIQNLWKKLANQHKIRPNFSNKQFHGATECIMLNNQLLSQMKAISLQISSMDHSLYIDYNFQSLSKERQQKILKQVQQIINTKSV